MTRELRTALPKSLSAEPGRVGIYSFTFADRAPASGHSTNILYVTCLLSISPNARRRRFLNIESDGRLLSVTVKLDWQSWFQYSVAVVGAKYARSDWLSAIVLFVNREPSAASPLALTIR